MLDKYFGFTQISDENSVIDALLEHTRIDEEEIYLLSDMISFFCSHNSQKVEDHFSKIQKINADSSHIFESIADQIIQSNFNHQKQYDLLRLYQRIEAISARIVDVGRQLLILHRVGGVLPEEMSHNANKLMNQIVNLHHQFKTALVHYQNAKQDVITIIHRITEMKTGICELQSECIETLYTMGNQNRLPMGHFRALEKSFENLSALSNSIEDAATSLEWLLI